MEESLSPARFLAYQALFQAMHQALEETRGVRIGVPQEQVALLKRAFYQVRKTSQDFKPLALLSTASPTEFLIYHPKKEEISDG